MKPTFSVISYKANNITQSLPFSMSNVVILDGGTVCLHVFQNDKESPFYFLRLSVKNSDKSLTGRVAAQFVSCCQAAKCVLHLSSMMI